VSELSWAGDRDLLFGWTASAAASQQASGLRLLDTERAGTNLLAAPLIISDSATFNGFTGPAADALASPDGSTIFLTLTAGAGGGNPLAEVVQFSVATAAPSAL
jgi:hypothetical protein